MSQGPRRGWVRALFTGLGVVVCTGLVGCMNSEKDRFPPKIGANTNTKQLQPGLPGTTRLPGQPGSGVGVAGQAQPNTIQPAIGYGSPAARQTGAPTYSTTVPGSGLGAGGAPSGVVPTMGPGVQPGAGSSNFGSGLSAPSMSPSSPIGNTGPAGYGAAPPMTNLSGDPGPIPPTYPGAPSGYEVTPPSSGSRYGG